MHVRACPECGSDNLRPSSFRLWPDLVWALLRRSAMRCRECSARSYHRNRRRHSHRPACEPLVFRIIIPHPPRLLRALFRQRPAPPPSNEALFEAQEQDSAELVGAGD